MRKFVIDLKKKKEFEKRYGDGEDVISSHMIVLTSLCYYFLDGPKALEEVCEKMFDEFKEKESAGLDMPPELKSSKDLHEVALHGIQTALQFKLLEKKENKYWLTEKGFNIGKGLQSFVHDLE